MRFFSSEFAHNYGTYSFGYCNYCVREERDSLFEIYKKGFLPYSGSSDVWNTFYMARSARLALSNWEPNSENRRVQKKYEEKFTRTLYTKEDFVVTKAFEDFCLSYFERHHGAHAMPEERFLHILKENALTHIAEYREGEKLVGYAFLASDNEMTHVWFYFYAPEFSDSSCGMWLFLNETGIAQKGGNNYFYLGTVYGDKSKYKTNFSNLEFWDGEKWIEDVGNKEVKSRIKNDGLELVEVTDKFKADKENFFKT